MGLTCNIDRRGRAIRGIAGLLLLGCGAAMLLSADPSRNGGMNLLAILLGLLGAFMVFEAILGWCAIRAMGKKTPF